ncbi:MAG TPA: hypothetical protein VIL20_24705 [Sandaracinaceae bacterium]
MAEKRISTPLVLAAASAMLAVAAVVWIDRVGGAPDEPPAPRSRGFVVDDSTPERAAESFYDAWRRRRWAEALEVSVGHAREEVLRKQQRDQALPADERIVAERMWDALANAPLTFVLDEAETLGPTHLALRGTAEYELIGRPYRRRVELEVVRIGERYRVSRMRLGEVLTELPPLFRGAGEEDRP